MIHASVTAGDDTSATQIQDLLADGKARLRESAHDDDPVRLALYLLSQCSARSITNLLAFPEATVSAAVAKRFHDMVRSRLKGIPVAYIVGVREFYGRPFKVTPDTLIPRPETETLIEFCLSHVGKPRSLRLLDLGTGSGIIAITLALELTDVSLAQGTLEITAVDRSREALAIAQQNALTHDCAGIKFVQSHWFDELAGERFDFVVSNPPYVEASFAGLTTSEIRHEPRTALVSGEDGLADIKEIISAAPDWLNPGGYLAIEHAPSQAADIRSVFERGTATQTWTEIDHAKDLTGATRATIARRAQATDREPRS